MNKSRRAALAKALPLLEQAAALVAQARAQISSVKDDEEEAYDNMSDGQKDGDQGNDMQQAIETLTDAIDTIDSLDLATVAKPLAELANASDIDVEAPALSAEDLQARRVERLAPWAKDMIARAERRAEEADARLAESFGEPDPENTKQIVIDDYMSPMRGKVVPSEQVTFPGLGIRVSASRDGRSLELHGLDMGCLTIRGQASNSVLVRLDRDRW